MESTDRMLRNSGDAYRQFRSRGVLATGIIAGAHEMVIDLLRHKLVGGTIAAMGTAGLIGVLITFWPY